MIKLALEIPVVLTLLLYAATAFQKVGSESKVAGCNEKDRVALSIFKQGIVDPSNRLSTWSHQQDCCAWTGVVCDNHGRVTKLDLHRSYFNKSNVLQGDINLSLLQLEFLSYFDLSWNQFERIIVPSHDTQKLENQSLVAHHNFSKLQYLDLSHNDGLHIDNLDWLTPISSLQYLDLTNIYLHMEVNWLQSIASLPSLSDLWLRNCQLTYISPSFKNISSSSLVTLDLSHNHFHSQIPNWLLNLSLSTLDLSYNNFSSPIPDWSNYRSLNRLSLSGNKLNESIPEWFGQLEILQNLDLSQNLFHGYISSTLANLSSFGNDLDISFNSLSGDVSKIIGEQFEFLGLSHNSFSGDLSKTLLKSEYIFMASNNFKGGPPIILKEGFLISQRMWTIWIWLTTLSPLLCHSTVNQEVPA